jgi:ACS family hexuronate transporter-like MFS transporter
VFAWNLTMERSMGQSFQLSQNYQKLRISIKVGDDAGKNCDAMNRPRSMPPVEPRTTGLTVKPRKVGRVQWWIVWTLFFSTVTNYISRQTFSVLSPMISAQYHLSHTDLAKILGAFQISYAVTWLLGGIFLDAVGTRLGLAIAVIFWSVVNLLTGFAGSVFSFASFRFLLGIGEGFNWPAASKTVAEWFPGQERSIAVAIFDSGSSVGGALAAIVIPLIALTFGWRWSFVFSGLLGFIWLAMWLRVYHPLDHHPRVTGDEVALIRAGQDVPRTSAARGFSLKRIAFFSWMPFVAADIGNFTGGFISGYLVRRGISVLRARTWVCAVSCLPILAGIPAARVHSVSLALALICIALWGYASWSTMG